MNHKHWEKFYIDYEQFNPSPFGEYCLDQIKSIYGDKLSNVNLLDLGCGDGRDAELFAEYCKVSACDYSQAGLNKIKNPNIIKINSGVKNPLWHQILPVKYDVCYSRFFLHAINYKNQENILEYIFNNFDYFFIECRSNRNKDTNYYFGGDHKRWLVDPAFIIKKLSKYENINYTIQSSNNLAIFHNENPYVIRIEGICQK
jgi:SAM-dependent methyltransferase